MNVVGLPNLPIFTVLSAKASITGRPAIVLTENSESLKSSVTVNSRQFTQSTAKTSEPEVDPLTYSVVFDGVVIDSPSPILNEVAIVIRPSVVREAAP